VFNSTQSAFRAGVTQTDVLEGSRAAMDLMVSDLKLMTPSGGTNGFHPNPTDSPIVNYDSSGVNFFSLNNGSYTPFAYSPLLQNLPGSISNAQRTNVLSYIFLLGRQNQNWTGVGYVVNNASTSPLYPLYRFSAQTNRQANPVSLFVNFINAIAANTPITQQWTNMSHLIDGVVDLRVRAYDMNGYQMTNASQFNAGQFTTYTNVAMYVPQFGEVGFYFFGNTVPASVELQLGVLENRPLQRAESLAQNINAQTNYLAQQAGRVHIFRQHVLIPNVDPTAYQ
jgi:hypothetical protein